MEIKPFYTLMVRSWCSKHFRGQTSNQNQADWQSTNMSCCLIGEAVGAIAEQEFVCKKSGYINDLQYKFSGLRF